MTPPKAGVSNKQQLQEAQYQFPYHYLPQYDGGLARPSRHFGWGLHYIGRVHLVVERLRAVGFDSLLDVGCGDGRLINLLSRLEFPQAEYFGVDLSPQAIQLAQALNPQSNVTFRALNLLADRDRRASMRQAAHALARPEAAQRVGELLIKLADAR